MIPVRLELKNFMSYGDDVPALDFAGMHTICLSGENGNGKSALLDAITWSLWGESRAGKNRHDDLVRIGADEMSVHFTFEMDGFVYRVMRKRSKRAGGNQWELQQQIPESGWRSLTGNSAGETEKAIQKLLRMSYDTFINSAYLRQGQADLFVQKSSGQRKEILADILDLSRYEKLEKKALERAREAQIEAIDVERDINLIDVELAAEDGYRETLVAHHRNIDGLRGQHSALKKDLDDLNKQIGQLEGQKTFLDQLEAQASQLNLEVKDLQANIAEHVAEESRWLALLSEKDAIEKGYGDLLAAREELSRLDVDLRKYHNGRSMVADAEKNYTIAGSDADRHARRLEDDVKAAETKLCDLPKLKQQRQVVADRVAKLDGLAAAREKDDADARAHNDQFQRLHRRNSALSGEIDVWDKRLAELAAQSGTCLVCNAPLPPERAERVRLEYEAERQTRIDERLKLRAEGIVAKTKADEATERIKQYDLQLKGAIDDRVELDRLDQRIKELDGIRTGLAEMQRLATEARKVVAEESYEPELRKKLEHYRLHLAKLEDVPVRQKEMLLRRDELAPMESKHLKLNHAQEALTAAQTRRERDVASLESKQVSRIELSGRIEKVAGVAAQLAGLNIQCAQTQAAIEKMQLDERALAQDIGRCEQLIANCERRRTERVGKEERWKEVRKDHEAYDQLAKAFGKKGVQALIIENAVPEIQEEANRILERLTDGDMSIYFETLREARGKKDSPIETLEIKVSDNLGTRPLEMYSGGEGFRAAFALRIALSRLLARRAGARLQTLIIDEGFGTQDGKGRERLVEALHAIKSDFEKIIVITHIDELKDAFATRVEITKTPRGSQITVMEGSNG
jgi:exonuclease SbcC